MLAVIDVAPCDLQAIRSGNYPVLTEGHILLLNWNRQTVPLLRQLALARQEQYHKNRGCAAAAFCRSKR